MDGPDLAPATRKRTRPDAVADRLSPIVGDDLAVRLEAVEKAVVALRHDVANGFQEVASRAVVLAEATDEILAQHAESLARLEDALQALPEAREILAVHAESLARLEDALQALPETREVLASHTESLARLEQLVLALPDAAAQPNLASIEAAIRSLAEGLVTPIEAAVRTTLELRGEVSELVTRVDQTDVTDMSSQLDLIGERLSTLLGGPSLTELMDRIDELEPARNEEGKRRRRG